MWQRLPAAIPQPLVGAGSPSHNRELFPVSRSPPPAYHTSGFQPRFFSLPCGRGRMPLPQGRAAGCGLQVAVYGGLYTVPCHLSPVTRHPQPVSRPLHECGSGFQPVGAASSRDSSASPMVAAGCRSHKAGYRSRAAVHSGLHTVTRLPSPVSRCSRIGERRETGFGRRGVERPPRAAVGREAGGGDRETGRRGTGCGLRCTVTRNPSPVHSRVWERLLAATAKPGYGLQVAVHGPHRQP